MSGDLSTFSEMSQVLAEMPVILRNARRARRLSQRQVALEAGISFSTVSRMETGGEFSSVTLDAILRWLDQPTPEGDPKT